MDGRFNTPQVAAALILGSLGAVRGTLNGFEELLVDSRLVSQAAVAAFEALTPDKEQFAELLAQSDSAQSVLAKLRSEDAEGYLNLNTGSGIIRRIAMATFLPSQDILLEHILKEVHGNAPDVALASGEQDHVDIHALVGGAASGVCSAK